MSSEAWVAFAAVAASLLTTIVNQRFARSAQARQLDAEQQRLAKASSLETRRAREQRLWDARAKAYSDYLGWLQGSVRETLRDPEERLLRDDLPGGWWKTPYELRTSMLLFESDAVRTERGTLAESLSAIAMALAMSRRDARQDPSLRDGLRREADEALEQIDVITRRIRADMRAGLDGRNGEPDWTEELGELDAHAKTESAAGVEAMRQALLMRAAPESGTDS